MTLKKLLFILTAWLLLGFSIMGQTVRPLRLDELYAIADTASSRLRAARSGVEAARQGLATARAERLPEVELTLSGSYIGDGWLSDRDFAHGRNIDMPHWGNNFAARASQVLYAGGAISAGIRLAALGEQVAALDVTRQRQEVRFLLTGYYLELYKLGNQLQVLDRNIALTQQVLRDMEARRAEGTVLQSDITRYELQLETLRQQRVRVADGQTILNHQLVTTLHLPADTRIEPDTTLSLPAGLTGAVEPEPWRQEASAHNTGLQQAALAHEMAGQRVRIERASRLPHVALVAEEHLDGPILIEVPTIDSNFNYWYVGLGVSYSLSSLYRGGSLRRARAEARQAGEQLAVAREEVDQAVTAACVNLQTAQAEVRTQLKSVELADQNYDITANRYTNGLALLTDMLDASDTKLSASLGLVNARINLLYNYYKLKYITHTL